MTTGEIISLCAVALSLAAVLLTLRRDRTANSKDIREDAEETAQTITDIKADTRYTVRKLGEVSDDLKQMKGEVSDVSRRTTVCEESCKSAHKRIDGQENRLLALERRVGEAKN